MRRMRIIQGWFLVSRSRLSYRRGRASERGEVVVATVATATLSAKSQADGPHLEGHFAKVR